MSIVGVYPGDLFGGVVLPSERRDSVNRPVVSDQEKPSIP